MKRALITGITGQDGSYLAELLLAKEYEVHGVMRRTSSIATARLDGCIAPAVRPRLQLHFADLADGTSLSHVIEEVRPDEIYNLGAQSDVKISFSQPEYTADVVGTGALRLFESAARFAERSGVKVRVYQAGSSEMFGASAPPQDEETPFYPRSPYAVSKVAAHYFARNYREATGLFITNGILFNHESPRRGENFVTRKISRAVGRISAGLQRRLSLGNLQAKRDWGFAGDYVKAMWLMLQADAPGDYVVATGESHSVQEFAEAAFACAGMDWREFVDVDTSLYRPTEVDFLKGDPSKAKRELQWTPVVGFKELVRLMVEHDVELARRERVLAGGSATA